MKILYTNSTEPGYPQTNPNISLGGHISGSLVPNDSDENLFPLMSLLSEQQKRKVVRALALQNNNVGTYTGLTISFDFPADTTFNYKFAVTEFTIDASGCEVIELIPNGEAIPLYATFETIVAGTTYNLGNLLSEKSLGLWLIREFKSSKKGYVGPNKKDCAYWKNIFAHENDPIVPPANPDEEEGKEYFYINLAWT